MDYKMNLLFTICARAGSKGVRGKNSRQFLGLPLCYYTLAAYKLFCEVHGSNYNQITLALNTDSEDLRGQAENSGVDFIYVKRREFLAGDAVSKTDVIKDTVKEAEADQGIKFDVVVDIDLTSPLRTAADIEGVISALRNNNFADVAFSATNARRLPFFNMVRVCDDRSCELVIKSEYVSRQQAPECFDMNASIYAYKNEFITSNATKRVFDGKAVLYKMTDTAVLDIDHEEDFELLEVLARYFFDKNPDYGMVEETAKKLCRDRL